MGRLAVNRQTLSLRMVKREQTCGGQSDKPKNLKLRISTMCSQSRKIRLCRRSLQRSEQSPHKKNKPSFSRRRQPSHPRRGRHRQHRRERPTEEGEVQKLDEDRYTLEEFQNEKLKTSENGKVKTPGEFQRDRDTSAGVA